LKKVVDDTRKKPKTKTKTKTKEEEEEKKKMRRNVNGKIIIMKEDFPISLQVRQKDSRLYPIQRTKLGQFCEHCTFSFEY